MYASMRYATSTPAEEACINKAKSLTAADLRRIDTQRARRPHDMIAQLMASSSYQR